MSSTLNMNNIVLDGEEEVLTYLFNFTSSNYSMANMVYNNTYGKFIMSSINNKLYNNIKFNNSALYMTILNSIYEINTIHFNNTNFTIQATNSNLNMSSIKINLVKPPTVKNILMIPPTIQTYNTSFVGNNITIVQAYSPPHRFIYVEDSIVVLEDMHLHSYPYIDSTVQRPGIILSPYAITSINSNLNLMNSKILMFIGLLTGSGSIITVMNVYSSSNFTIELDNSKLGKYSYSTLFSLDNSSLSLMNSTLQFDHGFLDLIDVNITIDNCTIKDSQGGSNLIWDTENIIGEIVNSSLIMTNTILSDTTSRFKLNLSTFSLLNTIIQGSSLDLAFRFDVYGSSLQITNNVFMNSYGVFKIKSSSKVTIWNESHIGGGITINMDDSGLILNKMNCTNCAFVMESNDGNVSMYSNFVNNPNDQSQSINLGFNSVNLYINNTILIDNNGLITISNSNNNTLNNVTFMCNGPYINTGGISMNAVNSIITISNSYMINNYATCMFALTSTQVNIITLSVYETLTQVYIADSVFKDDADGQQSLIILYCIQGSYIAIQNSLFNTSYEILSCNMSNIEIYNSTFIGNNSTSLAILDNNIMNIQSGSVVLRNNTFRKFNLVEISLIMLLNCTNIMIDSLNFMNNTINGGAIVYIKASNNVNLNQLYFSNNNFVDSNDISVIYVNSQITISNVYFNDIGDPTSYNVYMQSSNKMININNCIFIGSKLGFFLSNINQIYINNITMTDPDHNNKRYITNTTTAQYISIIENVKSAVIDNSIFSGLVSYLGAVNLNLFDNNVIVIQNTISKHNFALQSAAFAINFIGNRSTIIVKNVTFENNTAKVMSNLNVVLTSYSGFGGCMFYSCATNMFCNMTIKNTTFINNKADIVAAAIYNNYFPPFIDINTTIFTNNTAPYNPDIASSAVQYFLIYPNTQLKNTFDYNWQALYFQNQRLLQEDIESVTHLDELISGRTVPTLFNVITMDIYQQIAYSDNNTQISLAFTNLQINPQTYINNQPPNVIPLTNVTNIKVTRGQYSYQNPLITFWPGSSVSVALNVSGLTKLPYYITSKMNAENKKQIASLNNINLTFRNCILGEILLTSGACVECAEGFYSLALQNNSIAPCTPCNFDVSYCLGTYMIAPNLGYWRKNKTADLVLKCPNVDSCLGSPANITLYVISGICANGYSGHLCNQCPSNNANDTKKCWDCKRDVWYYVRLILTIVILILLTYLTMNSSVITLISSLPSSVKYKLELGNSKSFKHSLSIHLNLLSNQAIKLLITFLQIMSIISMYDFNWPITLIYLMDINSQIIGNISDLLTLDCIIYLFVPGLTNKGIDEINDNGNSVRSGNNNNIDLVYVKYVIFLIIIPILYTMIIMIIWLVIYKRKGYTIRRHKVYMAKITKDVISTLIIINFIYQPYIILYALKLFQCINLYRYDIAEYYFTSDYDVLCYTNDYYTKVLLLSLPNIIFWCIIMPLLFLWYLKRNSKKNENTITNDNLTVNSINPITTINPNVITINDINEYSFLYYGYDIKYRYWEMLIYAIKMILIIVLVFCIQFTIYIQSWFLLWIVFISFMLHLKFKAIEDHILNYINIKGQYCLLILVLSGIYFNFKLNFSILDNIIIIICYIIFFWFLMHWLTYFLYLRHETYSKKCIMSLVYKHLIYVMYNKIKKIHDFEYNNENTLNTLNDTKLFNNTRYPETRSDFMMNNNFTKINLDNSFQDEAPMKSVRKDSKDIPIAIEISPRENISFDNSCKIRDIKTIEGLKNNVCIEDMIKDSNSSTNKDFGNNNDNSDNSAYKNTSTNKQDIQNPEKNNQNASFYAITDTSNIPNKPNIQDEKVIHMKTEKEVSDHVNDYNEDKDSKDTKNIRNDKDKANEDKNAQCDENIIDDFK